MFMLCVSSCFRATEEEQQAQSKKALKKQQKEAEKAAKKAEKQAKMVRVVLFSTVLLLCIRHPCTAGKGDVLVCGHLGFNGVGKPTGGHESIV